MLGKAKLSLLTGDTKTRVNCTRVHFISKIVLLTRNFRRIIGTYRKSNNCNKRAKTIKSNHNLKWSSRLLKFLFVYFGN